MKLKEDDSDVIDALVQFFYTLDYDDALHNHIPATVSGVRTFIAADKYFVEPLVFVAGNKFEKCCEEAWSTLALARAIRELYINGSPGNDCLKQVVASVGRSSASPEGGRLRTVQSGYPRSSRGRR